MGQDVKRLDESQRPEAVSNIATSEDLSKRYPREEREQQIAAVRHLSRKTQKNYLLRPKSLIDALATLAPASAAEIRALAEIEYGSPVTSLYLRMDADSTAPRGKALLRVFHSLRTHALTEQHVFIEALSKTQKVTLDDDLKEIEVLLEQYFVAAGPRSLIIFKCGEQLNRVFRLPARTIDAMVIGGDPHVAPLEAVLEENEKVLFVEVSIGESRLLVYHLGAMESDRVSTDVARQSAEPPFKRNEQRHLSHVEWHLKATAIGAYHLFRERSCSALILMGEKQVLASLEEFLHETLQANIISRIHASPAADPRDRKELIETALADNKSAREATAIGELAQYKPGDQLVSGLADVIEAFNSFLVRKLVIGETLQQKGYVCTAHHYFSLEETSCPIGGEKLVPTENIVDEFIETAYLHGVTVMVVEHRQDLLTPYSGIAAVTYPRLPEA
jgi:hypothetical protein